MTSSKGPSVTVEVRPPAAVLSIDTARRTQVQRYYFTHLPYPVTQDQSGWRYLHPCCAQKHCLDKHLVVCRPYVLNPRNLPFEEFRKSDIEWLSLVYDCYRTNYPALKCFSINPSEQKAPVTEINLNLPSPCPSKIIPIQFKVLREIANFTGNSCKYGLHQ